MLSRSVVAGVLFTLAIAAVAVAGTSFSISASNTDPFDNEASPSDSLRNIYLWATCIDDGMSALEAGLSGSLSGPFTPLNGVMNLGSGGDLLLVVPGCPSGAEANFLLGYWTVWDSGGTVCLGPSNANDWFATADCAPNPNPTFDPWVTGFSSSVSSVCEVGSAPCGSSEALAASYSEMIQLDGSLIRTADWSPVGTSLVFNRGDSCFVAEVDVTETTTRKVLGMRARRATWAPDGAWLLVETRTQSEHKQGVSTLTAVRSDGEQATTIEGSTDIGFFVWGEDGNIYVWRSEAEGHTELAPPAEWSAAYEAPDHARPVLVQTRTPGLRGVDERVFWPGEPEERNTHVTRFAAERRNLVVSLDRFPRGGFLVRVYEPDKVGYDLLLDANGDIVVDYRGTDSLEQLMRNSVSSDGRYIVAYDPKDDGHEILSSQLYLVSPTGSERVPLEGAPMSLDPRLSNSGQLIATEGLNGGIHVGEISVTGE